MSNLTVAELPREKIVRNPGQPRKTFEGIEELAASIAENGLLQPITVRPVLRFACGHITTPATDAERNLWTSTSLLLSKSSATQPASSTVREASGFTSLTTVTDAQSRKALSTTAKRSCDGSKHNGELGQSIANETAPEAGSGTNGIGTSTPLANSGSFSQPSCPTCRSNGLLLNEPLSECQPNSEALGQQAKTVSLSKTGSPSVTGNSARFSKGLPEGFDTEPVNLGSPRNGVSSKDARSMDVTSDISHTDTAPSTTHDGSEPAQPQSSGTAGPQPGEPTVEAVYSIVAGERRFRAMSLLEWATVPCIIRDLEDANAYVISVMENVAHRDMNVIEEAAALQQLLETGMDAAEIERRLGLPQQNGGYVTWKVSFLRCIEPVQHLLKRGQISQTVAGQLSKLSPDGQLRALREYQARNLTQSEFTTLANTIWNQENQIDMFPETKLSKEALEAVQTFRKALATLTREAVRLDNLDVDALGEALAHDATVEAQIAATITTLQRAKRGIHRQRGRKVALDAAS